jgi:ATP:corrinoid adenosyltransferase
LNTVKSPATEDNGDLTVNEGDTKDFTTANLGINNKYN